MKRHLVTAALLSAACGATTPPQSARTASSAPDVSGWEGFFSPTEINDRWLASKGIAVSGDAIAAARPRVVRLIIASGPLDGPKQRVSQLQDLHCQRSSARVWNENLCGSLEAAECSDAGSCRYQHYGSCSGIAIGHGWVVTAAHCLQKLAEDAELAANSKIIWSDATGSPRRVSTLGEIRLGKTDFDHHWVSLGESDPVDVAGVRTRDGDVAPIEAHPLPAEGEQLFVFGFPRVERRTEADRARAGYELVGGTPSVSFGRMADRNALDRPLCNVDGRQEHWALTEPCPSGSIVVDGTKTWRGVITRSPFLTTYDSCNGYSGAPVFDSAGRWIGINVTLASKVDPQERYSDAARMVGVPALRAVQRLKL